MDHFSSHGHIRTSRQTHEQHDERAPNKEYKSEGCLEVVGGAKDATWAKARRSLDLLSCTNIPPPTPAQGPKRLHAHSFDCNDVIGKHRADSWAVVVSVHEQVVTRSH